MSIVYKLLEDKLEKFGDFYATTYMGDCHNPVTYKVRMASISYVCMLIHVGMKLLIVLVSL